MPIPVINYTANPVQGDPIFKNLLSQIQQGMALKYAKPNQEADLSMKLANVQNRQLENQYYPQDMDARLAQLAASTQGQQLQNQYYPQDMEAKLAQLSALTQGQNLGNQLDAVKLKYAPQNAEIDLAQKEVNVPYTKQKMDLLPYQAMGQYYSGLGKYNQSNWQSSPNAQLLRVINNPQMQSLINSNPDVAKAITQTLGNIGLGNNQIPQNIQNMPMQGNGNQNYLNNPSNNIGFSPSDLDVYNIRQNAGDSALKRSQTAQQINQQKYGAILGNIFDQADQQMPSVIKYAGLGGAIKKGTDSLYSALGSSNKDYENYNNFVRVTAPNAANEMRRVLGGQATDYESKLLNSIANPATWSNNPQLAMSQWNSLKDLYQNHINRALYENTSKISNDVRNKLMLSPSEQESLEKNGIAKRVPINSYNQQDIEYTAKKYGMSVDDVRKKLGI